MTSDGTDAPARQQPHLARYRICVEGRLHERRAAWFEGMTMAFERASHGGLITTLTGAVADQARLRGILSKLWDLNLTLISVTRIETREAERGMTELRGDRNG